MSVLTEAKIRKFIRESLIAENGCLELAPDERLTPAAKSYLSDHRIKVIQARKRNNPASENKWHINHGTVTRLEESSIYPYLFRLTSLYPKLLRNQLELHGAFQNDRVERVKTILGIIEKIVGQTILADISEYDALLPTGADLQSIRIQKQLDQLSVMMHYQVASWQVTCYDTYVTATILRKELELLVTELDDYGHQICSLLKSIEVLLWLIACE